MTTASRAMCHPVEVGLVEVPAARPSSIGWIRRNHPGPRNVNTVMRMRSRVVPLLVMAASTVFVACGFGDDSSDSAARAAAGDGATTVAEGSGDESGVGLALPAGEPIQAGRSIIATADVSIEVDDARAAAAQAGDVAASNGGFLAQQEARPADGVVTLTLRVPTEQFRAAMGRIEALGKVLEHQ